MSYIGKTPVLTNLNDPAQAAALKAFVASIKQTGHSAAAQQEAVNIAPYIGAMSRRLQNTLATGTDSGQERLKSLATPGALTALFNATTAYTRNTLLSEVMVLPDSYYTKKFNEYDLGYKQEYDYEGHKFIFGFRQIETSERPLGSVTVPIFCMDTAILDATAPFGSEKLLGLFQSMITTANHDPLHHFTSIVLNVKNPEIANKYRQNLNTKPLGEWQQRYMPDYLYDMSKYEAWAQVSHEKIILDPENTEMQDAIRQTLRDYFAELQKLAQRMAAGDPEKGVAPPVTRTNA